MWYPIRQIYSRILVFLKNQNIQPIFDVIVFHILLRISLK